MTPSEIVQYARTLSKCRVDELPDSDLFSYLNIEYRRLWQDVAWIDKNYKLRVRNTNLVSWVSSYALLLPFQAPTQATGQIKIESVFVTYDLSQKYPYRAKLLDWDNLNRAPEWYADNQPKSEPFYIVTDNSIQIFPTPDNSIPNGLQMYSNQRPYDLDATMTEADILIEREYHDIMWKSIIPYVYEHRQQDERVWYYQQKYEVDKQKMLRQLKKRVIRPMKWYNASFKQYVY